MPEETKMAVEAEASPAKKPVIGKAAHCKVTMLDGTENDVYVDVIIIKTFPFFNINQKFLFTEES